jgi:hypothetical protein
MTWQRRYIGFLSINPIWTDYQIIMVSWSVKKSVADMYGILEGEQHE